MVSVRGARIRARFVIGWVRLVSSIDHFFDCRAPLPARDATPERVSFSARYVDRDGDLERGLGGDVGPDGKLGFVSPR